MFELDEVQSHTPFSVFLPSSCMFMCVAAGQTVFFCCVSEQTTDWALLVAVSLLEHFLHLVAFLSMLSGYQWKHSYIMLHSTQKGRISNYKYGHLILQIGGISHIRWDPMNNFSSCVKEYPINIGYICILQVSYLTSPRAVIEEEVLCVVSSDLVTFPSRYQIPKLFSSLWTNQACFIIKNIKKWFQLSE